MRILSRCMDPYPQFLGFLQLLLFGDPKHISGPPPFMQSPVERVQVNVVYLFICVLRACEKGDKNHQQSGRKKVRKKPYKSREGEAFKLSLVHTPAIGSHIVWHFLVHLFTPFFPIPWLALFLLSSPYTHCLSAHRTKTPILSLPGTHTNHGGYNDINNNTTT